MCKKEKEKRESSSNNELIYYFIAVPAGEESKNPLAVNDAF